MLTKLAIRKGFFSIILVHIRGYHKLRNYVLMTPLFVTPGRLLRFPDDRISLLTCTKAMRPNPGCKFSGHLICMDCVLNAVKAFMGRAVRDMNIARYQIHVWLHRIHAMEWYSWCKSPTSTFAKSLWQMKHMPLGRFCISINSRID